MFGAGVDRCVGYFVRRRGLSCGRGQLPRLLAKSTFLFFIFLFSICSFYKMQAIGRSNPRLWAKSAFFFFFFSSIWEYFR